MLDNNATKKAELEPRLEKRHIRNTARSWRDTREASGSRLTMRTLLIIYKKHDDFSFFLSIFFLCSSLKRATPAKFSYRRYHQRKGGRGGEREREREGEGEGKRERERERDAVIEACGSFVVAGVYRIYRKDQSRQSTREASSSRNATRNRMWLMVCGLIPAAFESWMHRVVRGFSALGSLSICYREVWNNVTQHGKQCQVLRCFCVMIKPGFLFIVSLGSCYLM